MTYKSNNQIIYTVNDGNIRLELEYAETWTFESYIVRVSETNIPYMSDTLDRTYSRSLFAKSFGNYDMASDLYHSLARNPKLLTLKYL